MAIFQHNTFVGQTVEIDGHVFEDNVFINCTIVYAGGLLNLRRNAFQNCRWRFDGPAGRTVGLLGSMYASGGYSQQQVIEALMSMAISSSGFVPSVAADDPPTITRPLPAPVNRLTGAIETVQTATAGAGADVPPRP